VTETQHPRLRRQWSRTRTFLFLLMTLAVAALAWYVAGVLATVVVIIAGLVIVSYLGTDRFANWRTGRPSRARREMTESILLPPERAGQLRAGPDVVETWLRERSLDELLDERNED
jgi:Flp pilus assembly protein TadB